MLIVCLLWISLTAANAHVPESQPAWALIVYTGMDRNQVLDAATGDILPQYKKAVKALDFVFEKVIDDAPPAYSEINRAALEASRNEVVAIVKTMCTSDYADVKATGLELAGHIGWRNFEPELSKSLNCPVPWERITAIYAIERVNQPWATDLLWQFKEDRTERNKHVNMALDKVLGSHSQP